MIQSYQAAHGGVVFYRTPSVRRRARRMRVAAITVTFAVALSAGVLQQFHDRSNLDARLGEAQLPIPAGAFAHFPR